MGCVCEGEGVRVGGLVGCVWEDESACWGSRGACPPLASPTVEDGARLCARLSQVQHWAVVVTLQQPFQQPFHQFIKRDIQGCADVVQFGQLLTG